MIQFRALLKSPWPPFWLLVAFNVFLWAFSLSTGDMQKQMGMAVDYTGQGYSGSEREKMVLSFIVISAAVYFFTTVLSAVTLRICLRGNRIAFALFLCLASWSLYQCASNPYVLNSMYPGTIGLTDWVSALAQSIVWCFIIWITTKRFLQLERNMQKETIPSNPSNTLDASGKVAGAGHVKR